MAYTMIKAKPISYGGTRPLSAVQYIVIHYTACKGDTARNECNCFKYVNTRAAGAHFFADQFGDVCQSIPIKRVAWSVGGAKWDNNGGSLYGVATNYNTVSIELCDLVDKAPSEAMTESVRKLVAYIQKKCPNAKTIIRHWDVNGKPCPVTMIGTDCQAWFDFRKAISGSVSYKVKITKAVNVRKKASAKSEKIMTLMPGGVYTIVRESANKKWGKLKSGAGWIRLSYTKKV